jgi:aminoglycoside phosphotransferase (APT) family kinase protein
MGPGRVACMTTSSRRTQWADCAITDVSSTGTDHALYRLGDAVARVPLRETATRPIDSEFRWLPWPAERLLVAIPRPTGKNRAEPQVSVPLVDPLMGSTASAGRLALIDRALLAVDLARLLRTLHALDADGGPPSVEAYCRRGIPLRMRDASTRGAIASSRDLIDVAAVTSAWKAALDTPEWTGPAVWVHGDLAAGNLIIRDRRLAGVIDWACMAVGDPACDLAGAWELLDESSRDTFRAKSRRQRRHLGARKRMGAVDRSRRSRLLQGHQPFMADQARHKLRSLLGDDAVPPRHR